MFVLHMHTVKLSASVTLSLKTLIQTLVLSEIDPDATTKLSQKAFSAGAVKIASLASATYSQKATQSRALNSTWVNVIELTTYTTAF
jgi:hypothetical protein